MKTIHFPPYKSLLQRLTAAREAKEWTQEELGLRLGRPQSYVSKVEAGQRRLDVVEFAYWTALLEVDPIRHLQDLLDDIGEIKPRARRQAKVRSLDNA